MIDSLIFIKENPDYNRAELMIEFAKLHVREALKAALNNSETYM